MFVNYTLCCSQLRFLKLKVISDLVRDILAPGATVKTAGSMNLSHLF